jgi:hypothetical protein
LHAHAGQSSARDGDFTYRCDYREILYILRSILAHANLLS